MLRFNDLARTVSSAALALALVCPIAAHAAADEAAAAEEGGIQDIVVMARKRAEASQTVPLAITAVGEKELATRSVVQVADVKALVPSISMQSDQYTNFGVKFGIRGQHTTDTLLQSQNSVGIYMDGVYVANSAGLLMANMADIKQMEVLKGPQGTLFGRNTTGGALVISTNLPSYDAATVNMKLGAGNFGRMEGSVTANLPLSSNAALRVTGQYFNFNGYAKQVLAIGNGPRSAPMNLADQQSYNIRGALMFDPSDTINVIIRADYGYGESHGRLQRLAYVNPTITSITHPVLGPVNIPTNVTMAMLTQLGYYNPLVLNLTAAGVTQFGAGTPGAQAAANYIQNLLMTQQGSDPYVMAGDLYSLGHIREYGFSATETFQLSDDISLKSITAYRHMNYLTGQDSDSTFWDLLNSPSQLQRLDVFSQELNLNGEAMEGKLKWTVGGYYFHQVGEDKQVYQALAAINPVQTTTWGHFTQKSYAAYGQAMMNLTDELRLTAGLRYTNEQQDLFNLGRGTRVSTGVVTCDEGGPAPNCGANHVQKANNLSYTFSLDYKITPDVMVYARTSRGFKGGGTNERGGILVGSAFKPEIVTDYEIGLKSYLMDRKVRFNLAIYQSEYKDIQRVVIVPAGSSVTSVVNNAAAARIKGVEVDLLVQPVEGLSMSFSGAYTDPRYLSYTSVGPTGGVVNLSGNSFQAVPKWSWNAGISYDIPVGNGVVRPSVDYSYQSSVNFQSDSNSALASSPTGTTSIYTSQSGYGLLNARLAYEFNDGKSSVAVWGKNLTDKYYLVNALDVAQSLGLINQGAGAPRTFGIEFKHQF